jgi:hypothetical protein
MTVSMNADQVIGSIQLAAGIGAFIGVVVLGLLIYLLVRPSRRPPPGRVEDADALDPEEVLDLLERMNQRLGVLERAMVEQDEAPKIGSLREDAILQTGDESPETRRAR